MKKALMVAALTLTTSVLCADQYGKCTSRGCTPAPRQNYGSDLYSRQKQSEGRQQYEDPRIVQELQKILGRYPDIGFSVDGSNVSLFGNVQSQQEKNKLMQDVKSIQGVRQVDVDEITVGGQSSGNRNYQYGDGNNGQSQSQYSEQQNGQSWNGNGQSEYQYGNGNNGQNQSQYNNNGNYGYGRKYQNQQNGYRYGDQDLANEVQARLDQNEHYRNVEVTANNGVVRLRGFVMSKDAKKSLEREVKNMSGVRDVKNSVTIQSRR